MSHRQRDELAEGLLNYLNTSPTPFQAVANAAATLEAAGFTPLRESEIWRLEKGGKHYVVRNRSALIAFEVGQGVLPEHGFRLIGVHTDSPSFKIKPGPNPVTADGYVKLNTEAYGGGILSTWLDRPLSVAGRVMLRPAQGVWPEERLVDLRRPLLVIPNLCVHFNREINSGYAYNKQVDMMPLLGLARDADNPADWLMELVAAELDVPREAIADWDLFLYEAEAGVRIGPQGEFLSASRLDNLSMLYAALDGLVRSSAGAATRVLAAFDNEEVGNTTLAGTESEFLPQTLRRIAAALGGDDSPYVRACSRSAAVSADCTHAVHPNHADRHDPLNRPVLGGGPAVKYSANQKYATTAATAALFTAVCQAAGVPCQSYVNRSDLIGGSTIGPTLSTRTGIPTVDVGTPILAMHSIRELGHVDDIGYTTRAFGEFFTCPACG